MTSLTKLIKRNISIIFAGIVFFAQNPATAQQARLSDITITNTRDSIELVYLNVKGTFTEEMKKAVLSGVPITFSFFITLDEVRRFWKNRPIAEITLTHTIKYHNLKKEFAITRSYNDRTLTARSFSEAELLMNEIRNLKIISSDRLEKGIHYQLKAKAQLNKVTLPLYLHYILFFVSLWDFETEWQTIDFTY